MKRLFLFLVVLVVVMGLMVGCGSGDTASTGSSTQGEGVVISTADVAFIDANGESVYRIVRPVESVLDETTPAALVFKQMKSALGIAVKNVSDDADGTDAYEILIGATNRPESQQALDYLKTKTGGRYDDYIVCTVGKKLNDDFHTYGLIWDDKHMGFTCDGVEYFSYDTTTNFYDTECFNRHLTLTFSMATGFATSADSKITDDPDEWQNSNKLIADYINVYQYDDGLCSIYIGDYN